MSALPMHPTELDRERFRDLTKAMQFGLEYDRRLAYNGDYTDPQTVAMFRLWWSVERERQLLQNLNMSQGCKLSELLARAEKAEAELARMREQEPVAYVKYKTTGGNVGLSWLAIPTGEFYPKEGEQLYAAPVAAPAVLAVPDGDDFNGSTPHLIQCMEALVRLDADGVLVPHGIGRDASKLLSAAANRLRQQAASSVPEEWRKVMAELADDLAIEIDQNYPPERKVYPSEQRRYEGEMEIVNRARALLKYAEVKK